MAKTKVIFISKRTIFKTAIFSKCFCYFFTNYLVLICNFVPQYKDTNFL